MTTPTTADDLRPGGEWLSKSWLLRHGFREQAREDRQPTTHYRRSIGGELRGGRPFMGASDDLCVEVALSSIRGDETVWFCWLVQVEPRRHIHLRMVECTWEIEALYEGLTGRKWTP